MSLLFTTEQMFSLEFAIAKIIVIYSLLPKLREQKIKNTMELLLKPDTIFLNLNVKQTQY
jgi:hypothetical protein